MVRCSRSSWAAAASCRPRASQSIPRPTSPRSQSPRARPKISSAESRWACRAAWARWSAKAASQGDDAPRSPRRPRPRPSPGRDSAGPTARAAPIGPPAGRGSAAGEEPAAGPRPAPRPWDTAGRAPWPSPSGRSSPGRLGMRSLSRRGGSGSLVSTWCRSIRVLPRNGSSPAQQLVEETPRLYTSLRPSTAWPSPLACSGLM